MSLDCIVDHVQGVVARAADRIAVQAAGRPALGYSELSDRIARIGAILRHAGVRRGETVAIVLPEGPDTAVAIVAISAFATCAPLNPAYSASEFAEYFHALRPALVLVAAGTGSQAIAGAHAAGVRVLELTIDSNGPIGAFNAAGIDTGSAIVAADRADASQTALLLFTSGTSARPKLVPLSHGNLFAAADSIRSVLQLTADDVCLGVMPLFHIHGLSTLLATLLAGGTYVGLPGFSPEAFYDAMQSAKPTWYSASPTIHRVVLDHISLFRGDARQSGLRFIRSASAPMPQPLIADMERAFGVPFVEAYGMTEAGPQIASNRLPPTPRKAGSVGPAAGPEVAIMDAAGVILPPGEVGEVVVRGMNITAGYIDDAEANRSAFVDGWLRTGDLGRLDHDNYLFITGRLKELINRGGEKISPRRVDDVLHQHPAVAQAVTFAVPHSVLGEDIAAAIVLKSPADDVPALIAQIRAFAAGLLAPFEVPHRIVFVESIPLGPAGKVVRTRLAEQLGLTGQPIFAPESAAARTPTERRIAQVFADVLRTTNPGVHDDFFAFGGHSLAAMQVITRLRQIFHVDLPMDAMFHAPTVAELAVAIGQRLADLIADGSARLDQGSHAATPSSDDGIPRRTASTPAPLSLAQQRLFFINLIGSGNAYNMSASLRLTGVLDRAALDRSLSEIVRRHESLRTTFRLLGDEPVQIVADLKPIELALIDLADLGEANREGELHRIANDEARKPFDLAAGPLFRASLVRVSERDHLLLLNMHHIVSDGWSVGVLHRELGTLYKAYAQGHESPLEPLAIQYVDFAAWQRGKLFDAAMAREMSYWTDQLRDIPPVCTFPADHPRPALQTYRGATHRVQIDAQCVSRIREISQHESVTPFMTFLAAFKTLLFRCNGQEDCFVGIPIANRPRKELEPLVGFFANTLVLRTSLAASASFSDLLARVRATATGAFAHQDVPLERLVEALHVPRNASHSPLFQVMFAFQNLPGAGVPIDFGSGLSARAFAIENDAAKFDLTLYLSESDGAMTATWQYNADLYDASTIERFATYFLTLLDAIAINHRRPLSELPLLTDDIRRRIEIDWNRTEARRVHRRCFLQLFDAQVRQTPDAIAVMAGADVWTYRTLDERSSQIANFVLASGIEPGTPIGVCLKRSAEHLAVLLGIWKAGCAFLPLDPEYPSQRLTFMLADAGASVVLTEDALQPRFAGDPIRVIVLNSDAIRAAAPRSDPDLPSAEALAYVIYTSGSTGRPKGVMIPHGNVCHYAQAMTDALGLTPQDRYLHTASFAFSSSVRQFTAALSCGAAVVVATPEKIRDPHAMFQLAKRRGVTVIDLVPSMWTGALHVMSLLDVPTRTQLLDGSLRLALSASEPLPTRVAAAWREILPARVTQLNMFGQTETTGIVTTYLIPPDDPATAIVPIGRPIANTQVYVLDASAQIVPVGIVGELYVGGAGVGRGYINQPELTARSFIPNPFSVHPHKHLYRTGDLARYRDDGVLEILGRSDGQIKIRGFRIEPGEIENVAATRPGVSECVVVPFAEPHAPGHASQTRLLAFVTPREVDPVALRDHLKRRLPEYMVPQSIHPVDRLPRTTSGKVDRTTLVSMVPPSAPIPDQPAAAPVPASEAERILIEVWKQVLRLERVGVDENFFDLGGNSLLSISVVVRAKQLGLNVTLEQLYQNQTISELARATGEKPSAPAIVGVCDEAPVLATVESLRAYGIEALTLAGLDPAGAAIVTEVQLEASLRDQPTHHMVSIPRYAKRLSTGKINAQPNIRIEQETPVSARIDGDNGPGQWVSTVAMGVAIAKAQASGVGMVSVRRSNHFGAAAQYVFSAANVGLIGLCTTNGPLILAPTGGVRPTFGNNPVGVGIPASKHFPILLDIAMSVAPRGRIGLAIAEGKPLPPGWILDRLGRPSTDLADLAAGLGVPIGGHKGYGLAMVMEVLAGALSGAGMGADHHRDVLQGNPNPPDFGHFFMAIDPALFTEASQFTDRVDAMIDQTKSGPLADGAKEILVPGEMELRARTRSLREGVRLRQSTYRTLLSYARDAGLKTRIELVNA